ncbi:uncharacterized protein (DUF3084 family) [Metapseudomonas resinovorans]|uniref:hypothetical protein n=1 Tax=Metapseudomonas resinovorans TaxID=53412 RepID=UPI003D19D8CE
MSTEDVLESSDFQSDETPIEHSIAAELTGTTGLSDEQIDYDAAPVPNDLAADVEAYDQHQDQKGEQRQVPLKALQEERAKRQQLQAALEQRAQQQAALEQQFQQWQMQLAQQQQLAQQAAEEAAIPSFAEDPEGYVKAREAQFAKALEAQQQALQAHQYERQAQQQAVQLQAEIAQVRESIVDHESQFSAAHPDYVQASSVVHENVRQQLVARYPGASPEQIAQVQAVATAQMVQHCHAQGIDPCAYMLERGRQLLGQGYQPASSAPTRSAPAPRPSAPRSLSDMGGAVEPRTPEFSLENIASMSDAEFDAAWQKMAKSEKPRFFK